MSTIRWVNLKNVSTWKWSVALMEDEDFELLRRMLRNHFSCTSSKVAREMLENWDIQRQFFTKVMPRDYKAVLAKCTEKVKVYLKVAVAY